MMIERLRAILTERGGDWPVRYAREVLGKTIEDLDEMEVVEVAREMLASGGRIARRQAIGGDFKARMSSMGCGCPVLYDNDSRGVRIQSSARVEHLQTCGRKAATDKLFQVESE